MRSRVFFLALVAGALLLSAAGAQPLTFTVNSPADIPDVNPGNGVCETAAGNGICTLRAAIQEANAHPGADTIILHPNMTYLLTRVGIDDTGLNGDLDITESVSIFGAGAASTIIDGNGNVTGERVFEILPCLGGHACDMAHPTNVVTISGVTIQHGKSSNIGGGMSNNATLTLLNSSISNNTASGLNDWGGGIYNSGMLTIINSTIANNTSGSANPYGGGIYNQGPMTITNSTISGNTTGGIGGGIFNVGQTATVKNSTISGNTALAGGGIYKTGSPLIVINSTISGNFSTGNGGGIYASAGTTSLFNVTITHNRANSDDTGGGEGGGVANATGSTLNFVNSMIALNEIVIPTMPFPTLDLDDCSGTITSQGNSIMSVINSDHCTEVGAVTIANPSISPLQDNGGPTLTHALLPGNPAIDAGNIGGCTDNLGAPLTTDQRGFSRPYPVGGTCDIGAFEARTALNGDFNRDRFTDYVLVNPSTQRTAIWDLHGAAYMSGAYGPTLPAGWALACVADVNLDAKPDYVLFNASTHRTAIWFLNNAALLSSIYGPTLPAGWTLIATVDINRDGHLDYVLFNASTLRTAVWFLDANAVLTGGAYGPTLPAGWTLVDAQDFNGDGKPDFLLSNSSTHRTALWYLNGSAYSSSAYGPTLPSGWTLEGAADFNNDGKPDYVLFEASTRRTALWYLNGSTYSSSAYGPTLTAGFNLVFP